LLRFTLLCPSSPAVFFADCVVESMANNICVCWVHCDDDDIWSGVFQLEQTTLFCGAQEGRE
jgi:hypothetical protein